ncbi:MAG: pro-sigmaK processing inhibitor BofA family protein [Candidatus Altiarchaeota archaeon]|nr:pro-sigmaK processing inhibitor BofA family protein [Candidatus Altiarchaeota archaeon]
MNTVEYVLLAAAGLVVLSILWELITKIAVKATTLILNSVLGLAALYVLDQFLGFHIPIVLPTILICGLFGLPGVASLAILYFFGYI